MGNEGTSYFLRPLFDMHVQHATADFYHCANRPLSPSTGSSKVGAHGTGTHLGRSIMMVRFSAYAFVALAFEVIGTFVGNLMPLP